MIVSLGIEDGLQVTVDDECGGQGLNPLALDELCAKARELFRDAQADARAVHEGDTAT